MDDRPSLLGMSAHGGPGSAADNQPDVGEQSWTGTYRALKAADASVGLGPADLERLSTAAFMLGNVAESQEALERTYHAYAGQGQQLPAARIAFWLALNIASRGMLAEASGWIERGRRILEALDEPCVEQGYLLMPGVFRHAMASEWQEVAVVASEAADIGRQFGDLDLVALAAHTHGRALLQMGRTGEAFRLLDEVMLSVTRRETSPLVTGIVYCSVIEGCYEAHEVRRAAEWTDSLSEWCGSQPDLVAFGDQCLAHRSEILRLQGRWSDSLAEAGLALQKSPNGLGAAQAHLQLADIHRLRGDDVRAEAAYRQAGAMGGNPQPGLALLRLAQGNHDAAVASIRRAVAEAADLLPRLRVLPAYVEIMVETGHLVAAREAAEEMTAIADQTGIGTHEAWAAHSRGLVGLANNRVMEAIADLRGAARRWQGLGMPYELARSRVAMAGALRGLGDEDAARLELDAAQARFAALGAAPDLRRSDRLSSPDEARAPYGLTAREVEVLGKLASGSTNRAIAEELVLSERTIDRHVSNIFVKLGVSTRSAATALAIRGGIV